MKKELEVGKKCWVVTFNEIKEGIVTDILPEKIYMDFPPIKDINQVGLFRPEIVFATPTEAAEYLIAKCKPKDEVKEPDAMKANNQVIYRLREYVWYVNEGIVCTGTIAGFEEGGKVHMVYCKPYQKTDMCVHISRVSRTYTEATAILNRMTKITNSLGQTLWLLPGDNIYAIRIDGGIVDCSFIRKYITEICKVKIKATDAFVTCCPENIYLTKQDAQRAILAENVCTNAIGGATDERKFTPPKVVMYINGLLLGEMEGKPAGSMGDVYSNVPKSYEGEKNVPTPSDPRIDALEKLVSDNQKYVFRHVDSQANDMHFLRKQISDLTGQVSAAESNITSHRNKIASLFTCNQAHDDMIEALQKKVAVLETRVELAISEGNIEGDVFEKRLEDFDKRQTVFGEALDSFATHFNLVLSRIDALEKPKSVKKP